MWWREEPFETLLLVRRRSCKSTRTCKVGWESPHVTSATSVLSILSLGFPYNQWKVRDLHVVSHILVLWIVSHWSVSLSFDCKEHLGVLQLILPPFRPIFRWDETETSSTHYKCKMWNYRAMQQMQFSVQSRKPQVNLLQINNKWNSTARRGGERGKRMHPGWRNKTFSQMLTQ